MTLSFQLTRKEEIRRFFTTLLLVSVAVLAIGLAGSFVVLQRVETQLFAGQSRAAEREAAIIARFIDRDLAEGAAPSRTISRVQNVLKGTGSRADFLCMLDEQGRVISHPDASMIGMKWADMDLMRLDTEQTVPITSVLRRRQPVTGLQREPDAPMQLVHYQPVAGEPWTIAVHKNTAVIAGEFTALRWKLLGAAVPTLLLISLVGVGLARSLGRRFEQELAAKNATLENRVGERTTELTQALAELKTAHERLLQGEKMHLLGELMAGIAHEINNPLAAINLSAELLAMGHTDNPRKSGTVISQQTQRVAKIVRNLLDFARNRPAERVPGSLTEVLRNAEELIAAELRQERIELETSISPDLPQVLMDAQQMEQVFLNLVRNAGQALAEQPGERRITVHAFTDGIWVAVQVRDNGPGIPAGLRAKVFDSFVTTKTDGTGLGLSLCKRFVESHGGRMELLAANDKPGACFQFRLPAINATAREEITTA
jgi:C4-dicarboxylate-specific signal transduction histidine kinase